MLNPKTVKTPAARARKARARARRRERERVEADLGRKLVSSRQPATTDKRFKLELQDLSLGPFGLKKGSLMSRGGQRRLTESTVGVAPYSRNVQVVMPRMTSYLNYKREQIDSLTGTEFIGSVASGATGSVAGDILEAILISPTSFSRTRLYQFAPLYQRYRFTRLNFIYEPTANATQSGQLIGFADYDVDAPLIGDTEDNLPVAAAHLGQRICQIWESQTFPFGVVDDLPMLYTSLEGQEDRLIYQGLFYLLAATSITGNLPLGNLYIEYQCEFSVPQLSPAVVPEQMLATKWEGSSSSVSLTTPFGDSPAIDNSEWENMLGLPAIRPIISDFDADSSTFFLTGLPPSQTFFVALKSGTMDEIVTTGGSHISWDITYGGDVNPVAPVLLLSPTTNIPASVTTLSEAIVTWQSFTTSSTVGGGYVSITIKILATSSPTITWNAAASAQLYVWSANAISPNSLPAVLSHVWGKEQARGRVLPRAIRRLADQRGGNRMRSEVAVSSPSHSPIHRHESCVERPQARDEKIEEAEREEKGNSHRSSKHEGPDQLECKGYEQTVFGQRRIVPDPDSDLEAWKVPRCTPINLIMTKAYHPQSRSNQS